MQGGHHLLLEVRSYRAKQSWQPTTALPARLRGRGSHGWGSHGQSNHQDEFAAFLAAFFPHRHKNSPMGMEDVNVVAV